MIFGESILSAQYKAERTKGDINKQKQCVSGSKYSDNFAAIRQEQADNKQCKSQEQSAVYINQEI